MLKLNRLLTIALIGFLPMAVANADPVFVDGGQTNVNLDFEKLDEIANLDFGGVSPAVIVPGEPIPPDSLPSVAFPINSRDAADPARPTTFFYDSSGFAPFGGTIEHTGSVFFNEGDIEIGNFSIGFDEDRVVDDASGFFVASTTGLEGILFDIGSPEVLTLTDVLLEIVGDLLISPEFANFLNEADFGDDLFAGDDFGVALVQATSPIPMPAPIPEPTTAILLGMGLVGLAGNRRRKAAA